MSQRRANRTTRRSVAGTSSGKNDAGQHSPPIPAGRRWLFRAIGALLLPVLVLGVGELALRLAGYGYLVTFFLEERCGDEIVVGPNAEFGRRFFPPKLTRSPTDFSFPREKGATTYRIFLFGESAALGDPRPAYGMGRYLRVLLEDRYPEARFEVIPAAMTAINSHALREVAAQSARYDGDLWIIYMGNNEMAGPFGALSLFGPKNPPLGVVRASLALKSTRIGQWLDATASRWRRGEAHPAQWGGLGMFMNQSLAPDDPSRGVVHEHFRSNLRAMIRVANRSHIPVLACTVAVNLADCPPFASLHSADRDRDRGATDRWEVLVDEGIAGIGTRAWTNALESLKDAARIDPANAGVRYLEGLCSAALGDTSLANEHFMAARDADALPFRADAQLNEIVREVAHEHAVSGVRLVDLALELSSPSPPGEDLFLDHVHFNFAGNDRVARILAREIESLLPDAMKRAAKPTWASREVIENRLGLTDWNRLSVFEGMLQRMLEPPFTGQFDHQARIDHAARRIASLRTQLHPRRYLEAEDVYREAIGFDTDDPWLHRNFAEFLETSAQFEAAAQQWRLVAGMRPGDPIVWFQQGRLEARAGRYDKARKALERALTLRPDLDEANLELGQLLFRQGKHEEALQLYVELQRRNPDNARVHRYMADPLAALERRPEAMECLREAVRLSPHYWEARYYLGVELALEERLEDARAEFAEVVRLRPDFILGQLNLGVALARTGRMPEARRTFERVLSLDPENAKASRHLQQVKALLRAAPTEPPLEPDLR